MSLKIESLCQGYGKRLILDDISFDVGDGEIVTVLGPNGSGKSTLIKTVCNVIKPRSGTICADGEIISKADPKQFSKTIGYVPQRYQTMDFMKVFDAVLIGRAPHMSWSYSDNDFQKAHDAMETMGILDLADMNTNDLSGGQMQKVTIARALAQEPRYLVLDEPTSALDLKNQLDALRAVKDVARNKGTGVLMAMHHLSLAMKYSDRILMLKDNKMYAYGTPDEVITEQSIWDVYGVRSEIMEGRDGMFVHICDD